MTQIIISGKTDIGLKRENNEDAFLVSQTHQFCIVSDGMGGAAAGELASRIFIETASDVFSNVELSSEETIVYHVRKAFKYANQNILQHVIENPEHQGMGCTGELLVICNGTFIIGHIGDSRTYRFRNGVLKQLTHDHSLVQNHLDRGIITPEEARNHKYRNIISRAIGTEKSIALDVSRGKTCHGDLFLLCSDGLTDMIDDEIIENILATENNIIRIVDHLIESANAAGGIDNVTVVLAQVQS